MLFDHASVLDGQESDIENEIAGVVPINLAGLAKPEFVATCYGVCDRAAIHGERRKTKSAFSHWTLSDNNTHDAFIDIHGHHKSDRPSAGRLC